MTPLIVGDLTLREWIDIQADLHQMDKQRREQERKMNRRR